MSLSGPGPDPALLPIHDTPDLPRVLLMGDSISMGYTLPVRARLQGLANVHHPAENCGDTGRGLRRLEMWLGSSRWDVIYFNFGLHDLKYLDAAGHYVAPEVGTQVTTVYQYGRNLRELVSRLKSSGARLIFATTTPVPRGSPGRLAHSEGAYNEEARRVMRDLGILVDDLHRRIAADPMRFQLPHNVHLTPSGYDHLANAVAETVRVALSAGP